MDFNPETSVKQHRGLIIRNGMYWWYQQIRGKRHHESLGVAVATQRQEAQALKVLEAKRKALQEQRVEDYEKTRIKRSCSSIGDLFAAYEGYAIRRDLHPSWRENTRALVSIVAGGLGVSKESVPKLGLDVLTPDLMLKYESNALAKADDKQKASNTIVSYRRKVRALFAKKARLGYGSLTIPDKVDKFLMTGDVQEKVTDWKRPDPELVDKTKAAGRKLRQEKDQPDIQAAWLLCYALALRAKEAAACRWDWFEVYQGQRVCWVIKRPDFKPKGREGYVPVPDAVWEWLQEIRNPDNPYVLSGPTHPMRYSFIIRKFSAWLQGCGWPDGKGAHAMRRLRGCEWWEDPAVGPALCSEWLRHSSILVTQRHYGKPKLPDQKVTIEL